MKLNYSTVYVQLIDFWTNSPLRFKVVYWVEHQNKGELSLSSQVKMNCHKDLILIGEVSFYVKLRVN